MVEDLFKLAVSMEEKGRDFYDKVSEFAKDERARKLFAYLRDQEEKHTEVFLKLFRTYAAKGTAFSAEPAFDDVIDTLLRNLLLPDISEVRDVLSKDRDVGVSSILRIGMEVEINTLFFYQKLKELVRGKQAKEALEKVIREEESHIIKLRDLRVELDPFYAGIDYGKFF